MEFWGLPRAKRIVHLGSVFFPALSGQTSDPPWPIDPSRPVVLHAAFFSALANPDADEASGQWQTTVAGLVVLRIIDRWIAHLSRGGPFADWHGPAVSVDDLSPEALKGLVEAAHTVIANVAKTDPKRSILLKLVASVAGGSNLELARELFVYAHALHSDAAWPLAADVYETVYQLVTPADSELSVHLERLAPVALERLGHCRRMMGDLEVARAAYAHGRAIALRSGDIVRDLRIRISEAHLLIHVGNLPAAVASLDATIAEACRLVDTTIGRSALPFAVPALALADLDIAPCDVVALARHDRGNVAMRQGDYPVALDQLFAAWENYRDPIRRERVWFDLARTLADMGFRNTAHDAYAILHLTAREREVQLTAAANLLELAVIDGEAAAAARYRQELEEAAASGVLPARLAAWVALYCGAAEARFGQPARARALWEEAIVLATRGHVNEVVLRADANLKAFNSGTAPPQSRKRTPHSPTVERVARTIHRLRQGKDSVYGSRQ